MIYKLFWAMRALIYAPFFGKFGLPSYLGKPIFLKGIRQVYIGKRVRIFPQLRMEVHKNGSIHIEDEVVISQNVHITAADKLKIGRKSVILANTFITDIDHDYRKLDTHILEQEYLVQPTEIGENCFIGMGVAIMAGTKLGKQCVVGANSVVRGKFPNYCVIAGAPAKIVKKYNPETKVWEKFKNEK